MGAYFYLNGGDYVEERFDVRIIDEMSGDTLIEFYKLSQRQLDDLYANVGVMQAVEIL